MGTKYRNSLKIRLLNYIYYTVIIPKKAISLLNWNPHHVRRVLSIMRQEDLIVLEDNFGKKNYTLSHYADGYEEYLPYIFPDCEWYYSRLRSNYYRKEEPSKTKQSNKRNKQKMQRLSQYSECSIFLGESGVDIFPNYKRSVLEDELYWEVPTFYHAIELKKFMPADESRAASSRSIGCLCYRNEISMVFSMSDDIPVTGEITEKKYVDRVYYFFKDKVQEPILSDAYIFSWNYDRVHKKLSIKKKRGGYFTLDNTYSAYYFIPYSKTGERLMRLLLSPFAKDELMDMVIKREWQKKNGLEEIEMDGINDENEILFNYLIPNIYRFKKFVNAARLLEHRKFRVHCFDFQEEAVKKELSSNMDYSVYEFDAVVDMYLRRCEQRGVMVENII